MFFRSLVPALAVAISLGACDSGSGSGIGRPDGGGGGGLNLPPLAVAAGDAAASPGATVHVSGAGSSDPESAPLSFSWTLEAPIGSGAVLGDPTAVSTTFVPDVAGSYRATLVVSDGIAGSVPVAWTVEVLEPIPLLGHSVVDAEYAPALDRIVAVGASPNALYVIDPATGDEVEVALPFPPAAVSVSPDGHGAVVAHEAVLSYVDLVGGTLVKTLAVAADPIDVVLAANGYAYVFPRIDQWSHIRCVRISDGVETTHTGMFIYAGTLARLHPGGSSIYGADNGLSPSDIEKYDISGGSAVYAYDSPYHGDYGMCGNLWFTQDGARILTACGNTFRASDVQAQDMTYAGSLRQGTEWLNIRSIAHSTAAGRILVLPGAPPWYQDSGIDDTVVRIHGDAYLALEETLSLPRTVLGYQAYPTHGRFVFFSADGTRRWALVEVDAESGLLYPAAIVAF